MKWPFKKKLSANISAAQDYEPLVENYGMFILHEPATTDCVVEIVAIHGLNGHYNTTWTWEAHAPFRSPNWLRDFLPQQISNARIMSYGYDSAVQFSKSIADIGSFADQLLIDLETERLTTTERSRLIIFICHSPGGLVFKKVGTYFFPILDSIED